MFETVAVDIRGVTTTVWKNAPATLGDILAASRGHRDATFLVYEDERLSFEEHFRAAATLPRILRDRFGMLRYEDVMGDVGGGSAPAPPELVRRIKANFPYSVEIDGVLHEHAAVADAAVIGIPHPVRGEEVGAVVQLRPSPPASEAEIQEHVASRLAGFKVPVRVWFFDQPLPRNPAGKILKRQLRDELVGPGT
jgi:hypothetical protein